MPTTITTGLPYAGHINSINPSTLSMTYTVLKAFTSQLDMLCGRPTLTHGETLTIRVPYYTRVEGAALTTSALMALQSQLSSILGVPVVLHWLRLSQPYLDATVLAEYISDELQGQTFSRVMSMLLGVVSPVEPSTIKHLVLPSALVGIKVNLGGRLATEASKPRATRQSITLGSLSPSPTTVNTAGSYTATNDKGSYTVKVWLSSSR
jgi:hypothetical protein